MRRDSWAPYGAAAGAVGVLLFLASALVIGDRPAFDAPGSEVAAHFDRERSRVQLSCGLIALAAPLFVWFLATVASLARTGPPETACAGSVAYGCGLVFVTLFMADVTALAVAALRPENLRTAPELATVLVDFEFLAMGMAALFVATTLAAFAVLSLRDGAIWPRWVGFLAAVAAVAYALRVGTLFTTEGPFAADGVLGIWVPVGAFVIWIFVASVVLALDLGRGRGGHAARQLPSVSP